MASDGEGVPGKVRINKFHAIETWFRGFRFRSRLEARWFRFFESLSIDVQYEPEGWQFPDGTRYLPDFFLPQINAWAEVKPVPFNPEELRKAKEVVKGSGQMMLLLIGPPDFRDYIGISMDSDDLTTCEYRLDIDANYRKYYIEEHRLFSCPGDDLTPVFCSDRYRQAVYDSRAERFADWPPPEGKEPFNAELPGESE